MSNKFHSVRVKDIRKETSDCVSIAFDMPTTEKDLFAYTQGQYISVKKEINGKDIRRSYSICSSPLENELRIAIKKVPGGIFSTYANKELKIGDTIELMPPLGKFNIPLDAAQTRSYIAFAAGSGITPILSIIKTTLAIEPNSTFTLVYGNKNRQSIIFKEALEGLKNKHMQRFRILYILSREKTDATLHHGRIDETKCNQLFDKSLDISNIDTFFICGPEAMSMAVKDALLSKGVDTAKIKTELFGVKKADDRRWTVGDRNTIDSERWEVTTKEELESKITVKLDGISFDFKLGATGESILDAALAEGADLPFACKGGVCCTCKAKLISGEVAMDVYYGLEPDEIEQGFILTCQSHPRSEQVVIDFDIR